MSAIWNTVAEWGTFFLQELPAVYMAVHAMLSTVAAWALGVYAQHDPWLYVGSQERDGWQTPRNWVISKFIGA